MKFMNWSFLVKYNILGLISWFEKNQIDPKSLTEEKLKELRDMFSIKDEINEQLSQINYKIDFFLAMEIRNRFWKKIDPKILKDLRTLKTEHQCSHLKGDGKTGIGSAGVKDFNVVMHTFINGKSRIKCSGCGHVWLQTDPNWDKALLMVKQSTNSPSSSEVLQQKRK